MPSAALPAPAHLCSSLLLGQPNSLCADSLARCKAACRHGWRKAAEILDGRAGGQTRRWTGWWGANLPLHEQQMASMRRIWSCNHASWPLPWRLPCAVSTPHKRLRVAALTAPVCAWDQEGCRYERGVPLCASLQ